MQDVIQTRGYNAEIYHPIGTLYLAAKLFQDDNKDLLRVCCFPVVMESILKLWH